MNVTQQVLLPATALLAGAAIGAGFGKLQEAALRRNQRRQSSGQLKNGWGVMPGSATRVAMLLMVLAVAQVACPLLFTSPTQWWVSGGVLAGYGAMLFHQLRHRMATGQ